MKKVGKYLAGISVLLVMAAASHGKSGSIWVPEPIGFNGYHIN